jgi:hypothetical protein
MNIVREELFRAVELPVMVVVTTNATIKNNGALVMGRGAAKQVRDKLPGIDVECGSAITARLANDVFASYQNMYGFLEIRPWTRPGKGGFGIFQVKKQYDEQAQLMLINYSCQILVQWIRGSEGACPVRMNFPGIGNGGLPRGVVEPVLRAHFDKVDVTVCVK